MHLPLPSSRVKVLACLAVVVFALVAPAGSTARADESVPIGCLKQVYLACDQQAATRRLTQPEMAACSQVAEQLLRHEFDGDLDRLLAWWRASRTSIALAPEASP